jgi:hypothetical protein
LPTASRIARGSLADFLAISARRASKALTIASTLAPFAFPGWSVPRLVPGGILLSHDYSLLDGVRQAFAEFTADRREQVIELPMTQCMLVKSGD